MKKKTRLLSLVLAVVMAMSLTACGQKEDISSESSETTEAKVESAESNIIHYPDPEIKENLPAEKPSANEDFFLYMNYEDIKNTEIPEGKSSYGSFVKADDTSRENMLKTLESGNVDSKDALALTYYQKYMDTDARDAAGWTSVVPLIEKIQEIKSVDQLYRTLWEPEIDSIANVFSLYVTADEKNSKYNIPVFYSMSLSLQDSAEYDNLTEMGKRYQDAYDVYYTALLKRCGYSDDEAKEVIAGIYDFESAMAKHMYTTADSYKEDYQEKMYNAFSKDELLELFGNIPISDLLEQYGMNSLDKYVVTEPEFFKALSGYISEDTVENVKGYIICAILDYVAKVSDTQAYDIYNTWRNAINGSTGAGSLQEQAYNRTRSYLPELTGDIYATNYCSEETKQDVEGDVKRILEVMKEHIQNAEWMSDETKQTALGKIDTMGVYIAYPEEFLYEYDKINIDDKDLFSATQAIVLSKAEQQYAQAGKEINKAAWGEMMSADTVNACYNPTTNSIYFPAAILQAPFYDADASVSARFGAIDVVIGHEITHAFDTSGSQYDQDGNMENWWTEEDRTAFSERTAKLDKLFSSYATIGDQCVSGELTVGENTADLGGLSMCLETLEKMEAEGEEVNYKEFFEAYAKVWFRIMTKETAEYFLKADPHAPNCLRTNLIVRQLDKFYETYGIEEGDTMYTAPDDRIKVW